MGRRFDEVMIVNPYDPSAPEGARTMNFYRQPAGVGYYGESPEYGYYGEPEYGFAEADYGDYGEMEPVGYYAESPELVGWGVGEDPTGMGCACGSGRTHGYGDYGDYGGYIADRPPRSIPNVIAATNLNEYGEPEYGESEYGETDYGESDYGEAEYAGAGYGETDYGEPEYGESDYGETDYGESDFGAYVAPADVSPTCNNFTSPPAPTPVPDHFRPYF
jgi:hypothetical protein